MEDLIGGGYCLKHTSTICAELEDFIKREEITLHYFAGSSGINAGTLSGILNGNRPIAIGQLDRMTYAMGLPEGSLYDLYIDEFFIPPVSHWRRLRPFMIRCAELKKCSCIRRISNRLLKDLRQITGIYDTAEILFEKGLYEAAAILYESVIASERSSHSERLAISYYRLFQIFQNDSHKGYNAAIQFLPYRYRLPEAYALNGLLMLAEVHAVRFSWTEVENYADELSDLAFKLYKRQVWKSGDFNPDRPLVYYYGKSYLFKAASYEYRGMFAEAKNWISEYADLSWFEGLDQQGLDEVDNLKLFAKANYINLEIKAGDRNRIPEYVCFLEDHPDEVVEGLITLLESANRYHFFIDEIIIKFSYKIEQYRNVGTDHWLAQRGVTNSYSKKALYNLRCSVFFQNFAVYNFRKGLHREGLKNLLYSMAISVTLDNKEHIVNSMVMFELYRRFASDQQCQTYNNLCRNLWDHEKVNVLGGSDRAYI
ncbi:hypothetical protein D3C78_659850 [compost metagenome]